jgi:hypothetical protein
MLLLLNGGGGRGSFGANGGGASWRTMRKFHYF